MNEMAKTVLDYGFIGAFLLILLVIALKYLPRVLEVWIKRAEDKNLMYDQMTSVINNNTTAFRLVERALENNTIVVQQNTEEKDTLKDEICHLRNDLKHHDIRAEKIAQDVTVLKHK